MTAFVDLKFRGLRVAHKAKLVESDTGAFLEHETPLPVGSPIAIVEEGKEPRSGRVVHVVEHEAGSGPAGMRLVWEAPGSVKPVEVPPVAVEGAGVEVAPVEANPEVVAPVDATPVEVIAESAGDTSDPGEDSGPGSASSSSDGTVDAPIAVNGSAGSGKKSKKNKKRR